MIKIIRWILGWVEFSVEGDWSLFLDRVKKGIWKVRKENGKVKIRCAMSDYLHISKTARRCGCRLKIQNKKGLPLYINRYKLRKGLIAGIIIICLMFLISSLFVWDVEVNGNIMIPTEDLINCAAANGLHKGSFIKFLNISEIEYKLEEKFPQIAWTSINRSGAKYKIEISETDPKPKETDKSVPCNVAADYDGVIISIEPYDGFEMVKAGDVVKKDDLLVSGIKENEQSGQVLYAHADAKVIAQVERETQFKKSLISTVESETEQTTSKKKLVIFGLKIPLYLKGPPNGADEKQSEVKDIEIFGFKLPFKIETTAYAQKTSETKENQITQVKRELIKEAKDWEDENLKEAKVLGREYKYTIKDQTLILHIKDTVEQRIDSQRPIVVANDK